MEERSIQPEGAWTSRTCDDGIDPYPYFSGLCEHLLSIKDGYWQHGMLLHILPSLRTEKYTSSAIVATDYCFTQLWSYRGSTLWALQLGDTCRRLHTWRLNSSRLGCCHPLRSTTLGTKLCIIR